MLQPEDCIIGARNEEHLRNLEAKVSKLEENVTGNNDKTWKEIAEIYKEIANMRQEFANQIFHRLPPWVTLVISLLSGAMGILAGITTYALKLSGN